MQQRSIVRFGVPLAVTALAVAACGSRSDTSSSTGSGGATKKTVKIGVIAPLSGDLSALGLGIQHSVELAVKQANDSNAIPGWKLEVVPKDDEAKPDPGKNAATALAGDKDVIGVVGTLNTSVSQQVQPVLAAQDRPGLAGQHRPGPDPGRQLADRPEAAVPDVLPHLHHRRGPGSVRGRYLYEGITKVATIHDKKAYGQGLVGTFTEEFNKLGGQVISAQTINPDDSNYQAVVSSVEPSGPRPSTTAVSTRRPVRSRSR